MTRIKNRWDTPLAWSNSFSFILPFIIAFIVLVIIVKYVFSSNPTDNPTGSFMMITPTQDQSEIYIYMSGDSKKRIEEASKMYTTDNRLVVTTWEAEIGFDKSTSRIFVDKGGEVKYEWLVDGKQTLSLENADMLTDVSTEDLSIKLKNFSIIPSNNSIIIFSQNTIASNVYILKGGALVKDYSKKAVDTNIGVWQQLTIMKNDLNNTTLQFVNKIEPLSDYIKTTNLFIKHNGDSLLKSLSSSSESGSGVILNNGSGATQTKNSKTLLVITSPEDESTVDESDVSIEWKIMNNTITKVTINDKEALLNKVEQSFTFKNFPLATASNNIVYKGYDSEWAIVTKGILTLYTSKNTSKNDASKKPSVTTYPISDKDFRIISPVENPYKTTDNIVRIEGRVNKWVVKYITINDFRLSKFPQLGTSWYYFANKDYGTMNDGINLYTIKYYGENDELLFTNLFTLVKEQKEEEKVMEKTVEGSGSTTSTGVSTEG